MLKNSSAFGLSLILSGLVSVWTVPARADSLAAEQECKAGMESANKELDAAKLKSPTGSVYVTKAAGLLAAGKTQQEFGKYLDCIEKVKRARRALGRAAAAG